MPTRAAAHPIQCALPLQPTQLIGRQPELESILALLAEPGVRLLTLTGSPGVGKTRLALEAAAAAAERFADGAWFVDLQRVSEADLVLSSVASTLHVREQAHRSILEVLREHLRPRQSLLVLDNFEQVVSAAPLLGELLSSCPALKVLVTSRMPLRVSWEHEQRVEPLRLPVHAEAANAELLARVPSVAFFLARARALGTGRHWTRDDVRVVADVCRRLDGLPLALELAAAQTRVLALPTLAERLGERLDLLTDAPRDWPARHATLRTAVDWSYRLLPESERVVFRRLGVFAGGCDLAAVDAVCGTGAATNGALVPTLGALANQSLLSVDTALPDRGARFRLLETLSGYALERLDETDEAQEIRDRHAAYFLALAERTTPELVGGSLPAALEVLNREYGNLRAALHWLLRPECAPRTDGLRLVGALGRFWEATGRLTEGSAWLQLALSGTDVAPSVARARALNVQGNFARLRGDYDAARVAFAESSAVAAGVGDQRAVAMPLANLGNLAWDQGDYPAARSAFGQAFTILSQIGEPRMAALVQSHLGAVACDEGAFDEALTMCEESLAAFRALGDTAGIASVLTELGEIAYAQDDLPRAAGLFRESLRLRRAQGDLHEVARSLRHVGKCQVALGESAPALDALGEALRLFQQIEYARGVALVLEHVGQLTIATGDPHRGVRLCGASAALRAQSRSVLPSADRPRSERTLNEARSRLGRRTFSTEWTLGEATSLEDALRMVQASTSTDTPRVGLTDREWDVVRLVADGRANKDIAGALLISQRTVEVHVSSALRKLGLASRTQLAVWARERG